jgi:hypothetical protein
MAEEFLTGFKRKSQRERFYSSMNYEEYCEVYGPPSPLFKLIPYYAGRWKILVRRYRC